MLSAVVHRHDQVAEEYGGEVTRLCIPLTQAEQLINLTKVPFDDEVDQSAGETMVCCEGQRYSSHKYLKQLHLVLIVFSTHITL